MHPLSRLAIPRSTVWQIYLVATIPWGCSLFQTSSAVPPNRRAGLFYRVVKTSTLWQLKSYMIFLEQLDLELCRNKHEPLTIHGEPAYLLPDTIHSRGWSSRERTRESN